jgi:hypothetical protein
MGKKKSRKSQTSLGREGHPKKCRTSVHGSLERTMNQQKAWFKGKRVMLTIDNPDASATNMRTIRVNARDVWGLPPMLRNKVANES